MKTEKRKKEKTKRKMIEELERKLIKLAEELEQSRKQLESTGGTEGERRNAVEMLERVRKIRREELSEMRAESERIVVKKQELVELGRGVVVGKNREKIIRLETAAGVEGISATGAFSEMVCEFGEWEKESGLASAAHEAMSLQIVRNASASTSTTTTASSQQPQGGGGVSIVGTMRAGEQQRQHEGGGGGGKGPAGRRGTGSQVEEITEEEFAKVSTVVRGRAKLEEVNKVQRVLMELINGGPTGTKRTEPVTIAELSRHGCKVTGLTGESTLGTLRQLRMIEISKQGITLVGSGSGGGGGGGNKVTSKQPTK